MRRETEAASILTPRNSQAEAATIIREDKMIPNFMFFDRASFLAVSALRFSISIIVKNVSAV